MQCRLLSAIILILAGCGTSYAQVTSGPTATRPIPGIAAPTTASRPGLMAPMGSSVATAPGTIPSAGALGGQLGAIQFQLGTVSAPSGSPALGTIAACPETALAAPILSSPLGTDPTAVGGLSSATMTSAMPTTTATTAASTVGTTPAAASPFGTTLPSGLCTQAATNSALNAGIGPAPGAASPLPDPGSIAAQAFGDSTVPLDATEIGGTGLSPLIAVPAPSITASPCVGGAMIGSSGLTLNSAGTLSLNGC